MNKVLINKKQVAEFFHGNWVAIQSNGWAVYNAPRPIPGSITWQGEFRHGTFFAAGPLDEFQQEWQEWDAWPVEIITNDQIKARLYELAAARKLDLDKLISSGRYTFSKLAEQYHFPWVE